MAGIKCREREDDHRQEKQSNAIERKEKKHIYGGHIKQQRDTVKIRHEDARRTWMEEEIQINFPLEKVFYVSRPHPH